MRTSNDYHADENDAAKVKIGASYRCIDFRGAGGMLSMFLPESVPAANLDAIAAAFNAAMEVARRTHEEEVAS